MKYTLQFILPDKTVLSIEIEKDKPIEKTIRDEEGNIIFTKVVILRENRNKQLIMQEI